MNNKKKINKRINPNSSVLGSTKNLNVDVKVGILHTIADAIYATPAGKIREAVANARDNVATWIIILVDQTRKSICIFDNGSGITKKRFQEIFESIGYGMLKHEPKKKLSYFGLGLMSIFQLGDKVKIFTCPQGEKEMHLLEVDTQAIFNTDNEDKSISSLKDSIFLKETDEVTRKACTPPLLNEAITKVPFKDLLSSFTEIIIENVESKDFETICQAEFVEELRKVLPLRIQEDEPFLKRITGKKNKEIRNIFEDEKFCKTIDVFFGIQEEDKIEQLWKYFPGFRSDLNFPDDNVYVGIEQDFAYYIFHSMAVDLHRSKDVEKESGFWIRNQNFLVKSADFLERPGPGKKLIDQPLKAWVFGEVFHKDMNAFLTVSRNDYLFEKVEFKDFRNKLIEIVNPLNLELRKIWGKRKSIVDGLVEPFLKLTEPDGAIIRTENRLRDITPDLGEQEFRKQMFERLKQSRNKSIENENSRVDLVLTQIKAPITLGEDENAVVKIDPGLKGEIQEFQITWDSGREKVVALISPDLFKPKETVFLGETFQVIFVVQKEEDPGVSIDVENKKIYINPFNEEMLQYSVTIFDVYVALQIADAISANKPELKKNVLSLLGARSPITTKYVTPLGDDLRRTIELARAGA
ncbi:MAG TPA: ATP-binding protein [archaeon]|nr:ATP-binding protein [archaeon]